MVTVTTVEGDRPEFGSIETAVRADVEALITAHPMAESLSELAYTLAHLLDCEAKDLAVAGISKELRETLVELAGMGVGDDDLADALSLPTSFRDAAQS